MRQALRPHSEPVLLEATIFSGAFFQKPMAKSAFSLVELLVVIAVIAVIAAIAIPNMANITQSADRAAKLRNSQNVVSVYNSYLAYYQATADSQAYPFSTKEDAVEAVIAPGGLIVTNNRLGTTNSFRVPVSSTNEIGMDNLAMSNGQLLMINQQ